MFTLVTSAAVLLQMLSYLTCPPGCKQTPPLPQVEGPLAATAEVTEERAPPPAAAAGDAEGASNPRASEGGGGGGSVVIRVAGFTLRGARGVIPGYGRAAFDVEFAPLVPGGCSGCCGSGACAARACLPRCCQPAVSTLTPQSHARTHTHTIITHTHTPAQAPLRCRCWCVSLRPAPAACVCRRSASRSRASGATCRCRPKRRSLTSSELGGGRGPCTVGTEATHTPVQHAHTHTRRVYTLSAASCDLKSLQVLAACSMHVFKRIASATQNVSPPCRCVTPGRRYAAALVLRNAGPTAMKAQVRAAVAGSCIHQTPH